MRPWRNNKRKWCWASQLPGPHDRLADAVELVRAAYFRAEVLVAIPATGEMLAVEVVEHGKRLAVCGRGGRVTVAAGVFWKLVEAARKAETV
ncbi:MAG: hypothetical protein KBA18_13590 [Kiritimatiellae bacterium]|nr:hypothetical protein [Kiritimatiellia bacterium]